MLGGVVINDRNHKRFYEPNEAVGGVPIATAKARTKSWSSGAYAIELPEKNARLTVELEGVKYAIFLPDGTENVKFDVIVSDLPAFKRAGKLLAAAKRVPEEKKDVRFATLLDLYMATQGVLVEAGAGRDHHAGGAGPQGFGKGHGGRPQSGRRRRPGPVRQGRASDRAEIAHTKAQPWFTDATSCARSTPPTCT